MTFYTSGATQSPAHTRRVPARLPSHHSRPWHVLQLMVSLGKPNNPSSIQTANRPSNRAFAGLRAPPFLGNTQRYACRKSVRTARIHTQLLRSIRRLPILPSFAKHLTLASPTASHGRSGELAAQKPFRQFPDRANDRPNYNGHAVPVPGRFMWCTNSNGWPLALARLRSATFRTEGHYSMTVERSWGVTGWIVHFLVTVEGVPHGYGSVQLVGLLDKDLPSGLVVVDSSRKDGETGKTGDRPRFSGTERARHKAWKVAVGVAEISSNRDGPATGHGESRPSNRPTKLAVATR